VFRPVVRHVPAAPEVPGSNPRWGEFQKIWVKKTLAHPHAKVVGGGGDPILTWETERHRVWVGAGVRVFFLPGEMALSSYLKAAVAILTAPVEFF
jgi:hypothetical protein